MIQSTIISYARRQLQNIAQEDGFSLVDGGRDKIIIEFPSGRNLALSQEEVVHQAKEFLINELADLNNDYK
jgi:hypothetical protein